MTVWVVLVTRVSEHSIITEVDGVYIHNHFAIRRATELRDREKALVTIQHHAVLDSNVKETDNDHSAAPVGR
jgi:hypothetical protein